MGVRWVKVKSEWKAFRHELKYGTTRGFTHDYVDFWVEKNRHMPQTWGRIESVLYPFLLAALIGSALPEDPRPPTTEEISAWCAMQGNCDIPQPPVILD